MKLGSHNSFTYLPPKHWWMYPFIPIARCQSKSIIDQYKLGARWFDLRIRYDKHDRLIVAHGLMVYKADVETVCLMLHYLNIEAHYFVQEPIYIRVLYEMSSKDKSRKAKDHELQFIGFCSFIQNRFQYLTFIGGQRKYDWKLLHNFNTQPPQSIDMYSSCTWRKWDDWLPWMYARIMNNRNWGKYKDIEPDSFMLADFIHHIKQ
ncbi:hypothetical protein [Duncaniella muris]|uniref:hypothetical protein n=1 Tax=Duncaniella muris TaxID=2094150 RepID=UPI0025A51CDE|nr:hypothetical protein [Duncaniella muris]